MQETLSQKNHPKAPSIYLKTVMGPAQEVVLGDCSLCLCRLSLHAKSELQKNEKLVE